LNFNKTGEKVKTKLGGIVTILISILLLAFTGLKLKIMFSLTQSNTIS
jgi:hypothetical protein